LKPLLFIILLAFCSCQTSYLVITKEPDRQFLVVKGWEYSKPVEVEINGVVHRYNSRDIKEVRTLKDSILIYK